MGMICNKHTEPVRYTGQQCPQCATDDTPVADRWKGAGLVDDPFGTAVVDKDDEGA